VEATSGEQIAAVLAASAELVVARLMYGQSLSSNSVLGRLHREGPARISVLAAESGLSQPAMTELVGRLEREGLVTRLSDPTDGRATLVHITPSGSTRLAQRVRQVRDRVVELLEMLPADDQATLHLAMRVASPLIQQLIQLAAQHPRSAVTARRR
jgi:DNA-binding MarR family transcriptional regulator